MNSREVLTITAITTMNSDNNNDNNIQMFSPPSPPENPHQKNLEENVKRFLHVACRAIPVQTSKYKQELRKDDRLLPLLDHGIYADKGLKSNTEKNLFFRKLAVDTAEGAKDRAERNMEVFAQDDLGPANAALLEAEEFESACEGEVMLKARELEDEWDDIVFEFEERKENVMQVVNKNHEIAKLNVDEKSKTVIDKVVLGKLSLPMCTGCIDLSCIFSPSIISFTADGFTKDLDRLTRQLADAVENREKALKDASKFDYVGGGAISVPRRQLTGAHIDLNLVLQAAKQGIDDYVVDGCPDMHSYLFKMCKISIGGVFLTLENLGVGENPQFRGVGLHTRGKDETKKEMIVRLVEAFTPKNVDLPDSIIALKEGNECVRLKLALQQQRNHNKKRKMENVVPKRRVKVSANQRSEIDLFLSPKRAALPSAPTSSSRIATPMPNFSAGDYETPKKKRACIAPLSAPNLSAGDCRVQSQSKSYSQAAIDFDSAVNIATLSQASYGSVPTSNLKGGRDDM
jgi:hypothetical protein